MIKNIYKVSIIIPNLNKGKYLEKCLISATNQTFDSLEIIIVDSGSTDSSLQIINRFAEQYSNIRLLYAIEKGVSNARNLGLLEANGEYICFLDADDSISTDCIATLYNEAVLMHSDAIIFSSSVINESEQPLPSWVIQKTQNRDTYHPFFSIRVLQENAVFPFIWLHFIKRAILIKNQIHFIPELLIGEDNAFILSYLPCCENIVFLSNTFHSYTYGAENSIVCEYNTNLFKKLNQHILIISTVFKQWKNYNIINKDEFLLTWSLSLLWADLLKLNDKNRIIISYNYFSLLKNFLSIKKTSNIFDDIHFSYVKLCSSCKGLGIINLPKMRKQTKEFLLS